MFGGIQIKFEVWSMSTCTLDPHEHISGLGGYSGYFGDKHGVNFVVSRQIGWRLGWHHTTSVDMFFLCYLFVCLFPVQFIFKGLYFFSHQGTLLVASRDQEHTQTYFACNSSKDHNKHTGINKCFWVKYPFKTVFEDSLSVSIGWALSRRP